MTETTLTIRKLCNKDEFIAVTQRLTERRQLEEACWNGFLQRTLPEVRFASANSDTYIFGKPE